MNAKILLFIAFGGAFGAVARYVTMSMVGVWFGHGFPYGTIVVNVAGSFILGGLVETLALVWSPSEAVRAMLVVGVLGSFTTFSTFSLDAYTLLIRENYLALGGYVAVSVILSVLAFAAGLMAFRYVWS
ncbi:MAG: CrcB family protein [Alphaproteobacteria bacterium]|nr:CrcB family protein [Alphaproteobacteria bacterium]